MVSFEDEQQHEKRMLDIMMSQALAIFHDEEEQESKKKVKKQNSCVKTKTVLGKRKRQESPNLDYPSIVKLLEEKKKKKGVSVEDKVFTKPLWLNNKIQEVNGVGAKMIFEKQLTKTDLTKNQNRLLIPWLQIKDMMFLTEEEWKLIDANYKDRDQKGVEVILLGNVDSKDQESVLNLRRWGMDSSDNYVLTTGWYQTATDDHELEVGDIINLWTFHAHGRLYFAIVNVSKDPPPEPDMVQDALPQVPPLAPDMTQDALALVPAPVVDPPLVQDALVRGPAPNAASSSSGQAPSRARTVRRDYDEAEDRMIFVDYPRKRRNPRVPVTPPNYEADDNIQTKSSTLHLLAKLCMDLL